MNHVTLSYKLKYFMAMEENKILTKNECIYIIKKSVKCPCFKIKPYNIIN